MSIPSRFLVRVLLAGLPTLLPGLAFAQEAVEPFGEWRFLFSHSQDFPLNAAGDKSGLNWFVDQRLDVGAREPLAKTLLFTGEMEILNGQVAGDHDGVGAAYRPDARLTLRGWDLKQWELRQLWFRWDLPWFQVRLGHMGSHWGLGLLANDGRTEEGRFGFPDKIDLVERAILATKPFSGLDPEGWASRIVVALGGDIVYRDENANLRLGDIGGEALLIAYYEDDTATAGFYLAGRFQSDAAGTYLDVGALDLYGRLDPGEGHSGPTLAAEAVFLFGKTDRVIRAEDLGGLNVQAFGAVARAGWRFQALSFNPEIELGFASGDSNPHDDRITAFSFDPSYKVGLVLFDVVLRGITAMDAQQSADPKRVGTALPGVDQLASAGRVSGAVYLFPTLRLKPIERLTLMGGLLYAWSTVPFAQSYQTFANGGVATNPYGVTSTKRDLGLEVDVGADWNQPLVGSLHLLLGIQAGWFFPGGAFERQDGSTPAPVARLLARAGLNW